MKIIITGATGLIGQAFIERYAEQHQFHVVSRSYSKVIQTFSDWVKTGRVEYTDLASLPDLNDFDAVINLAGEPIVDKRWTAKQKQSSGSSRWDITQRLVELCHASTRPPAQFRSGSAIGIYGRQTADTIEGERGTEVHEECSREM